LEKYYDEPFRKKSSSPKFQVKNSAFISALSSFSFTQVQEDREEWGRVFESAIGAHLINNAEQGSYNVYYWRHVNDEIDFVIQKDNDLVGIEVKSGRTKPTVGMAAFKKRFNPKKVLLIGTSGLDWNIFLQMNPANLF
jgi:uncharacterized protein